MTKNWAIEASNDHLLRAHQHEVERLLGCFLLRVQEYEHQIKGIVAVHSFAGPADELQAIRDSQKESVAGKTLGALVKDLMGSYVVPQQTGAMVENPTRVGEKINEVSIGINISLPQEAFAKTVKDLEELVQLRNDLVHHFYDEHELQNMKGCQRAEKALANAYNRVDRSAKQLEEWVQDTQKAQEALIAFMRSDAFRETMANAVPPDPPLDCHSAAAVGKLRDAFRALAVKGWAPVDLAGSWIEKRYHKQCPKKFGCNSWRQVVHEASVFELRYLERDGKRTACYREKPRAAAPT